MMRLCIVRMDGWSISELFVVRPPVCFGLLLRTQDSVLHVLCPALCSVTNGQGVRFTETDQK